MAAALRCASRRPSTMHLVQIILYSSDSSDNSTFIITSQEYGTRGYLIKATSSPGAALDPLPGGRRPGNNFRDNAMGCTPEHMAAALLEAARAKLGCPDAVRRQNESDERLVRLFGQLDSTGLFRDLPKTVAGLRKSRTI